MKPFLLLLLLVTGFSGYSQNYNNEWIDYNKTYYKFKVGVSGTYRITQAALNSIGLGATPAEHFQLWRNGQEIRLYTSVSSGPLGATDYIEFWGEQNDGKADRELFLDPLYHLNDTWSLVTDTASFFLTVDPAGSNLRYEAVVNDVAGNTLPKDEWFWHKVGNNYRIKQNPGIAAVVGTEYLYASAYDKGEGWTSADLTPAGVQGSNHPSLRAVATGPDPIFRMAASGNAINQRRFRVTLNGDSIAGQQMDFFNIGKVETTFPLSYLQTGAALIQIRNISTTSTDRMVIHKYEIEYPRQFHFANSKNFTFRLKANPNGNYLETFSFNAGAAVPVMYDITNGKRYVANISGPYYRFALQASATDRELVMVSQDPTNLIDINSFETRNFIDYSLPQNQGNYMIISHPALFNGDGGTNPVDEYLQYRASTAGGSYNAKLYLIDQLIDQFAFGIKQHPSSIRNFIRLAKDQFTTVPTHIFIIGKGITYAQFRTRENHADVGKLALVPTFGSPASDNLLTAQHGTATPDIPIGRLSAISPQEVAVYLSKIKEYEEAQANPSPIIADRAWMKNVVHVVGVGDGATSAIIENFMDRYRKVISDTFFGGNVHTFSKASSESVQQLSSAQLENLFEQGISLITYFGHSSSSTLEFNLDDPANYNNQGKYPIFIALGCNAGNFFNFNTLRLQTKETLSEKFVLAPNRGSIGFIASTHFGIVHYLDIYNARNYQSMTRTMYGATLGEAMKETIHQVYNLTTENDFYARFHCEQTALHGDPAIRLNTHPQPDYVIEEPLVKIDPQFISIAENEFTVNAKMLNLGKALNNEIVVEMKREYPDQSVEVIFRDTIAGIRYADSITIQVPVVANRDKGLNRITVTIDADNTADEIFETNNSITREFFIYEDEARPIYPYNYAIVSNQNLKLSASTANPFAGMKQYTMELDTTEFFNSPLKVSQTVNATGGIIEFNPGLTFSNGTVYYWRVAPVPDNGDPVWNISSFIYLPAGVPGFNQSHVYQHHKSKLSRLILDSASRKWNFDNLYQNLFLRLGTWVTSGATQDASLSVSVNGEAIIRNTCWFQSVVFNVFDPVTFKPWENQQIQMGTAPPNNMGEGLYQSLDIDPPFALEPRYYNFEYRYTDSTHRRKAMDFMRDVIPDGAYVVVRGMTLSRTTYTDSTRYPQRFVDHWMADEAVYGSGQSLYHYLRDAGFDGIDSFYRERPWALVYKKNDPSFEPRWIVGEGVYDNPTLSVDLPTPDTVGYMESPVFGPAMEWNELHWQGSSLDAGPGDHPSIYVVGVTADGQQDTLMDNITIGQHQVDISGINAAQYPYIQLKMRVADSVNFSPYQLDYWRLTYEPVPEGAVAPNIFFQMKDTLEIGEPLNFRLAFKNLSDAAFDSLLVKMIITDQNNVSHVIPVQKHRPLPGNDTLHIRHDLDTRTLGGINNLYVEVNPDNDQPEQHHFNNFIFKSLYVKPDSLNPLLDVTFDGVHILNRDIVSAKPHVVIKLKDEAKWMILEDTSLVDLQVRFPDGSLHSYSFASDTMEFVPAGQAPNTDNTATINFYPHFWEDGDYELIVTGKDASNNVAGRVEYRVGFQVINKPMISNMLNYPNPFTTSTAFVFTITGSEVPQNIRIQIMTITGKIVREITKEELGPLHIGRNITEFKWDGTDQYGQKLANGIYLYRVITNLNGRSLDKYKADGDETDKYFNKGYGKMYLMR